MICSLTGGLKAQSTDLFQVIPFKAEAGLTSDDGFMIGFQLNSSQPYWGIQFEMKLPDGMTLDDTDGADPFELSMERFPYTKRGSKVTFKHGVAYGKRKDDTKWNIIVISPNDNTSYISKGNGEFLYAYIKTDKDMKPGVYPIYIRAALMVVTTQNYTRPDPTTSYCTIGDATLPQTPKVSLPDFNGRIPSWVVSSLESELNQNDKLRELELPNVDMLDADLNLANPNTLIYVDNKSKYAKILAEKEEPAKNIVTTDNEEAACLHLSLDERYGFNCTTPFSAKEVTLHRQPFTKGWNTLCLPFELREEQIKTIWGENAETQVFTSFDGNAINFSYTNGNIEAGAPCLIFIDENKSNSDWTFKDASVLPTPQEPSIVHNGVSFIGNLNGRISAQGFYGITEDNVLKIGGVNSHINGFRALFSLPDNLTPQGIQVVHEGEATGIKTPTETTTKHTLYTIDGKQTKKPLTRGVYIFNKQKIIIK